MGHDHSHSQQTNKKALKISFILISSFIFVELIGGLLTNSLALMSDAAHTLSDAVAMGANLLALTIGARAATKAKTFGYRRIETLIAFLNGLVLIALALIITREAIFRFSEPPAVSGAIIYIAIIGVSINVVMAWILMRGDTKNNLNMQSALIHVLGDLLGSVGTIVAGVLILLFDWHVADPIASLVVAVLLLRSGWKIAKAGFHILMEGTPSEINLAEMRKQLQTIPGVEQLNDLHVWSISSGFIVTSGHIIIKQGNNHDQVLQQAQEKMRKVFHINHATFQIQTETVESFNCCN